MTDDERVCVICERRPPQGDSLWCGGCYTRCHAELAELAYAHWWLGRAIETPAPAWKQGSIHVAGGSRPPLRVDLVDVRKEIEHLLRTWSKWIAENYVPAMAGPADGDPATVVRWMHVRLGWCTRQPIGDMLAVQVADLRAIAHATAPWERSRRDLAVSCPDCGRLSLSLYSGSEWAICRVRECSRMVGHREYRELLAAQLATARETGEAA